MKKKIKTILVFALPGMSILSMCAIGFQFGTRLILDLSYITGIVTAAVAFLDTYQGAPADAKACNKFWKYYAWSAGLVMIVAMGLYVIALMGSKTLVSMVTGLVPLIMPMFGAKLGFILKARRRP